MREIKKNSPGSETGRLTCIRGHAACDVIVKKELREDGVCWTAQKIFATAIGFLITIY